jgi:hypothetical protein
MRLGQCIEAPLSGVGAGSMRRTLLTAESLVKFVKRARERWEDFEVIKVIQKRSKQIVYVKVKGSIVKLVIYPEGQVRSFGKHEGLALAVKNILVRVLGIEQYRA